MLDEIRETYTSRGPNAGAGDRRYCVEPARRARFRTGHRLPCAAIPVHGQREAIAARSNNPSIIGGDLGYSSDGSACFRERHLDKFLPVKMQNNRNSGVSFRIARNPEVRVKQASNREQGGAFNVL